MWLPTAIWVKGADARPGNTAVLLHGILGSARNLRGLAGQLAQRLPHWQFLVADLRNHGDARGAPPPHTLQACADDVARLCTAQGVPPKAIVGHSYGGKVALQLLHRPPLQLRQVWVLDAQPNLRAGEDESPAAVEAVLAVLRGVPQPLAQRRDVADHLLREGVDPAVAQWMTTNVALETDGYRWRFDLAAVQEMLDSYFSTDSWPILERPPPGVRIDIVRAERSARWTPEVLARLATLRSREVSVHLLRDAGHWVHVDQPAALLDLLAPSLQRIGE